MGLRAFCEHVTSNTGETIRIELDSAGYSGSPLELIGTGRSPLWFSHEYEQLNKANVFDTIIQKSYAEFNFYNRGSAEQTLLDEILISPEGDFKLTKKINGAVDWVGVVKGDLSGFNDGEATPFPIKIVAKDFSILSSTEFPIENQVQTIIKVASRILANMGYNLPIHTRTSWVTADTDPNNDFMRQVYVRTRNLQDFGDTENFAITNEEALNRLLSSYKCIIKLTNGVFLIDQLSAYQTPTSVLTTVYDTNGDFVSQSNVNTVKAANTNIKVVTGSVNEIKPAYKRVKVIYNHRTVRSTITIPESITQSQSSPSDQVFSMLYSPEGANRIVLAGRAYVNFDQKIQSSQLVEFPKARIEIKSGSLYWNDAQRTWQVGQIINEFNTQDVDNGDTGNDLTVISNILRQNFTVFVGIETTSIPSTDSGNIVVTFIRDETVVNSTTRYNDFVFNIAGLNLLPSGNSSAYELVQSADYSVDYNDNPFWFGDGPNIYSTSALFTSASVANTFSTTAWNRRGTTPNRPLYENVAKEIMDSHRSYGRMLDAILRDGTYSPYNSLGYDLLNFYFIGGSFDAYTGDWRITAIQNAFFVSVTDTLNVGVIAGPSLITSGLFTAARLASNNAIEASGGYSFRTTINLSGTVSQIFVQSVGTTTPQLSKDAVIRIVHPVTLQDFDFVVSQTMTGGSNVIPVVPKSITGVIPVGSWVFTNTADATTSILLGRNIIRSISRSTAVGELATASLSGVTSIEVNLFAKVREGDDLFMINADNGTDRSFTVGQTAGPGLVTLQLDQLTVFDSPVGSYIVGSNAQYEGLLQVTPAGVLAKAVAITTQNAFAILSAPLSVGSVSSISVTSVRAIKLNAGTAIGVQDTAGNTVFFTIDVTQTLTVSTTSISVTTESISTAIGAGATVVQPMWNQSAQLSVQADQIALRVTETQVQTLIDENIGGLIPAVNFTFQNTDEGFTTSDVTLTTQPTYIEYLATDVNPFIEKSGLSIVSADNPTVTIRVVRIAGTNWNGAFGWSTDGTNFFSQSFAEPSNVDNDFSFATIDLTGNANYTGTITDIRLFLGNANNDEFYIDQISVGKFNPQTQILEDLSTRLSASESAITVEADRIDLFTQKSNELNRIAEVTGTYNQSSTFTTITLTNTRSGFEVRNGQALFLVNVDGTFQSVTVDGNQTLSTSLTINSEVFATNIIAGAMLYESSFTSSSRITQQAGTIVLKAEQVSGGTTPISKLALVRLDTSAADGSSILLQADQITLDGQTTFLNSLATNRFTQVASNNIVIESGTAPTVRPNASALVVGDVWRDTANNNRPSVWNGSIWGRGFTVINGGTITTGTVSADRIDVNGVITVGSIATEGYADGVAASALSDAEDYADGIVDALSDNTPRVFRTTTAPTTSNRTDNSIRAGDIWYKTDDGDLPHTYDGTSPFNANGWIRSYTKIDGGNITTGTINANLVKVQNSATNPDVVIDGTGITLLQNDGTNDTEIKRSVHWINTTNTTNQARIVSYSGMATRNVAIDAAGFDNERAFRFSVRRNISGNQDLSIGIAGQTNDFVSGSAQGDAVISVSNGKLWINDLLNITGKVVIDDDLDLTGDISTPNGTITANEMYTSEFAFGQSSGGAFLKYAQTSNVNVTIPSLGGNRTFSFIDQDQTITGNRIFDGGVDVKNGLFRIEGNDNRFLRFSVIDLAGDRIITIPNIGDNRTMAFIDQAQTFSANQTFTGTVTVPSLVLGSATNKATIAYTTDTARTYTIPNVAASDFVMSEGTQTINGAKTFGSVVVIPDATDGTHALNRTTGDGRYGLKGSANTWTGVQTFSGRIDVFGNMRLYDTGANNYGQFVYDGTANRTLTIPELGDNRTFAFIDQAQTFSANQTFTGTVTVPSLIVGSESAKATIAYTTDTARTYTIPDVAASNFVMSEGTQTINGDKTFGTVLVVQNATDGTHALNRNTGDARYGQLASASTYTANQTFTGTVTVPSLVLGSESAKATIAYTTNTARTYTIPDVGTNGTFALLNSTNDLDVTNNLTVQNIIGGSLRFKAVVSENQTGSIAGDDYIIYLDDASISGYSRTLPTATGSKRVLIFVDYSGYANLFAHTINRAGSDLINGATSTTINTSYGRVALQDVASGQWRILWRQ